LPHGWPRSKPGSASPRKIAESYGAAPLRRVAEVGPAVFERDILRGDGRHAAAVVLGIPYVPRHLSVELAHVEVPHDGRAHQVGLFQPAELFAVRAVGEHALQVALDGGEDQLMDAVQQVVGAGERADGFC